MDFDCDGIACCEWCEEYVLVHTGKAVDWCLKIVVFPNAPETGLGGTGDCILKKAGSNVRVLAQCTGQADS